MKKTINATLNGQCFILDEDAYNRLSIYLQAFEEKIDRVLERKEVIEELEERIAFLFKEKLNSRSEVVDITLVNLIINQLGLPDGSKHFDSKENSTQEERDERKFYRLKDNSKLGGVCNGLSIYFDIDITLVRVLFVILGICASFGIWAYIILWFVAPVAKTAAQKCELYRLPITAENIAKFTIK
jgi:phage shock protein PspC (stress-responsive transcriptional regulator)